MDEHRQNSQSSYFKHEPDISDKIQPDQQKLVPNRIDESNNQLCQSDEDIWKLRQQLFDSYSAESKGLIHKQIHDIRAEYLSQCFDLLLKIYRQTSSKYSPEQVKQWRELLSVVDNKFLDKYITIKIQTGELTNCYSEYWKSFLLHLWNQKIGSGPHIISTIFFSHNIQHLHKILHKIISDVKTIVYQSDSQSPIFSDQSFNPIVVKSRKSQKKYLKYKLCTLLSTYQTDKMRQRLYTIGNEEIRNKLISNMEKQLGVK